MTQEEVLEYNKRCAEFLGWKIDFDEILYVPDTCKVKPQIYWPAYQNLLFHSDWNWIMEVVEAIERITQVNIYKNECSIAKEVNLEYFKGYGTKKEAVVQAINQFLIWYYENNNQNITNPSTTI